MEDCNVSNANNNNNNNGGGENNSATGLQNNNNISAGESDNESTGDDRRSSYTVREQDRYLPIANVGKIMKKAVPDQGKISKNSKECLQECASEFISFITSEAAERCMREKRKTLNGEDLLFALASLGFDNYVEPLRVYLQKYRDLVQDSKPVICANGAFMIKSLRPSEDPGKLD